MKTKKLIVGNWKMNPLTLALARKIFTSVAKDAKNLKRTDVVMCPPSLYLGDLANASAKATLGAQDVSYEKEGAHTGDISPKMLSSLKVKYVIIGHSERRVAGESNELISKKVYSALEEGLSVILCIGEKERDTECTFLETLKTQIEESLHGVPEHMLSKLVIAYEPVWAIGVKAKGSMDAPAFLETSIFIRKVLSGIYKRESISSIKILYGGSVDENNTESFLKEGEAGGLLIGRASIDAKKFTQIIKIAEKC